MKKIFSCIIFSIASLLVHAQTSTFDTNDEGWFLTGDPTSMTPYHDIVGGNPGGYCTFVETQSGIYVYWNAPAAFLGNKSGSFGHYLTYDIKDNYCASQSFVKADVILQNGSLVLAFDDTVTFNNGNPDSAWTHYEIPLWDTLSRGTWWRDSIDSGIRANNADIQSVLIGITSLKIRGEYTFCKDTGSIDNVILQPSITSVNEIKSAQPQINLYPDPASEYLTVAIDNIDGRIETKYFITDLTGRQISGALIENNFSKINVSSLTPGIYFLNVRVNGEWLNRKFIVTK